MKPESDHGRPAHADGSAVAPSPSAHLDEVADEADEESFPASDPPSRWSGPPS